MRVKLSSARRKGTDGTRLLVTFYRDGERFTWTAEVMSTGEPVPAHSPLLPIKVRMWADGCCETIAECADAIDAYYRAHPSRYIGDPTNAAGSCMSGPGRREQ